MDDETASDGDGEPLPSDSIVFRLAKAAPGFLEQPDANSSVLHFKLSSEDEKPGGKGLLSVYAEARTLHQEGRLLFENPVLYRLLYRLKVADIRSIRPDPEVLEVGNLDVKWDTVYRFVYGYEEVDDRPGAKGHCGIEGLAKPPGMSKAAYTDIRVQLSRLGRRNMIWLPDDPYVSVSDPPDFNENVNCTDGGRYI